MVDFFVISIIFLIYWVHHNHVYVKYIFAEYARNELLRDFDNYS